MSDTLIAILTLLVAVFMFAFSRGALANPHNTIEIVEGRVIKVLDGDTFDVLTRDSQVIRVRVAGIDAPEFTQPWGTRARQALSRLILGRHIKVKVYKMDRYAGKNGLRRIGHVYLDEHDIGLGMIRLGLAWNNEPFRHEQPARQTSAARVPVRSAS